MSGEEDRRQEMPGEGPGALGQTARTPCQPPATSRPGPEAVTLTGAGIYDGIPARNSAGDLQTTGRTSSAEVRGQPPSQQERGDQTGRDQVEERPDRAGSGVCRRGGEEGRWDVTDHTRLT